MEQGYTILQKGQQKEGFSNTGGFFVHFRFIDATEWAFKDFKVNTGATPIYQFLIFLYTLFKVDIQIMS